MFGFWCVYVCLYVCMSVCMYACVHANIDIHVCTCAHHVCMHVCICRYIYRVRVYVCMCMHVYVSLCIQTDGSCIMFYIHAYIHTYHTHITYTYTYIYRVTAMHEALRRRVLLSASLRCSQWGIHTYTRISHIHTHIHTYAERENNFYYTLFLNNEPS
jgi:hypothetical protein